MDKKVLSEEFYGHLTKDIIPFWAGLKDDENGGFFGLVDFDHRRDEMADKGCILNSRILWFFSSAYLLFDELEEKKDANGQDSAVEDENVRKPEKTAEYRHLKAICMEQARHAYTFLTEHFEDKENGGVFWSVTYDGKPSDTLKHTYCHAFAIYALAAYFDASGDRKAFDKAMELADLIEERCTDEVGYLEAFNRDFTPAPNDELSENGVMADKTMNTLLHVFEAYTELLRVIKKRFPAVVRAESLQMKDSAGTASNTGECSTKDNRTGLDDGSGSIGISAPVNGARSGYSRENVEMATKIANRMRFILDIFSEKIYNTKLRRQEVFFDKDYNSMIDLHSYGHDIETSWLLDRGLEVLTDVGYTNEIEPLTLSLAERIYERAYSGHSLLNECEKGVDDKRRVWWVQAETVIGFVHASEKILRKKDRVTMTMKASGLSAKDRQETVIEAERRSASFFIASVDVWEFIKEKMIDRRTVNESTEGSASAAEDSDQEHIPAEWYSELDENLEPITTKNLVDSWKCPYHNGRMCIEMIRRLTA